MHNSHLTGRGIFQNAGGVIYNGEWTSNGSGEGVITYERKGETRDIKYEWKGQWRTYMPFSGEGRFRHFYFFDEYYGWADNMDAEGKWDQGMVTNGTLNYVNGVKFVGKFEYKRLRRYNGTVVHPLGFEWTGDFDIEDEENDPLEGVGVIVTRDEVISG